MFDDEVSQPACTFAYMSPVSYGWCYPNCAGLPKGGPSVRVVDTGGAFSPASVSLDVLGGDAEKVVFIACLYVQSGLPAGTYPGGLAFHVCTYAPDECADATLPYVLTMRDVVEGLPPLTATFEVDGA
ncbi:MAG TPA: hypothetical protein VML50_17835, partial [Anaeromyxobacter sp.]|nr:hypothetical protein [Anaeromyxobacter sp.]